MEVAKKIAWLGKAFFAVVAIWVGLGFAVVLFDRIRGYQLVTLKTRMYWENGKPVFGEKVKIWEIAIPFDIWLKGNSQSWTSFAWVPVYSSRTEDFDTDRYVTTLTDVLPDNTLVRSIDGGADAISFPLTFSNRIEGTASLETNHYPSQSITNGCLVSQQFVNYHGWMIRVRPTKFRDNSATGISPLPEVSDERICAIALKNLDHWTLRIDDLQTKAIGQ